MNLGRRKWSACVCALAACTMAAQLTRGDGTEAKDERPSIREFSLETLSKLGQEIYRHDQLAWKATDLLFAKIKPEQLEKDGSVGWVVETSNPDVGLVRFLRKKGESLEAGYDVSFPKSGPPTVTVPSNRELSSAQLAKAKATRAAIDAYAKASLPWCGGQFNTVVLDDPDGSGYLVYLLRPKPSRSAIPVGGHYRITVSSDGSKVEQIDQLFASCLTIDPSRDANGHQLAGVTMSHVVSQTPVETHVFLSLQEHLPFYVATMDGRIWVIQNGEIAQVRSKGNEKAKASDTEAKS